MCEGQEDEAGNALSDSRCVWNVSAAPPFLSWLLKNKQINKILFFHFLSFFQIWRLKGMKRSKGPIGRGAGEETSSPPLFMIGEQGLSHPCLNATACYRL